MTRYTRQIWNMPAKQWEGQEIADDLYTAQHRNEDSYIYWGLGSDHHVGVSEDHQVFRIVEVEDNWIIEKLTHGSGQWNRYTTSSSKTWKRLAETFVQGMVVFVPPPGEFPNTVYGISSTGDVFRLRRTDS